jgi:hypothetical protein
MRDSYNESLVAFRQAVDNLNLDFNKKLKSIDRMNEKIQTEFSPIDTKVDKMVNDIKLAFTFIQMSFLQTVSVIDHVIENNQDYLDTLKETDPNMFKLKNLATEARETAQKHEKLAKEYKKKVKSYTSQSNELVESLSILVEKLDKIKETSLNSINNAVDYSELVKVANALIKESNEMKEQLDNDLLELNALLDRLKQLTLSSFDQETTQVQDNMMDIKKNVNAFQYSIHFGIKLNVKITLLFII